MELGGGVDPLANPKISLTAGPIIAILSNEVSYDGSYLDQVKLPQLSKSFVRSRKQKKKIAAVPTLILF